VAHGRDRRTFPLKVMRYRARIYHRQSSCDRPYHSVGPPFRCVGGSHGSGPPLQCVVRPAQGLATDGPRVTQKPAEHTPLMKQNGCKGIICTSTLAQQGF
jgi:hypothetical protein